jgi:glucose/arabinose dehydrogenase
MTMKLLKSLSLILILFSCNNASKETATEGIINEPPGTDVSVPALTDSTVAKLPLETIKLPEGFQINVYAEVNNARSMALSSSGTLYVGNRDGDKVYAVRDVDGDFKADKRWVVASGLNSPNGVALKDGDLYIAETGVEISSDSTINSRILRLSDIENKLNNPGKPEVVFDKLPPDEHHGWKYIAFGPDGKLYVPIGAPCNICEPKEPIYASIHRMNADGTGLELFASGVRNTVGFTWHPETKNIWFTDNGRDLLGNDTPPCELNTAPKAGMHFGYPYCHGGIIKDPEFGNKRPCSDFTAPSQNLGAHTAPLGLKFYTGSMFPAEYKNQLFIAEHGSWNRSKEVAFNGYVLSLVKVSGDKGTSYQTFASGWLKADGRDSWGRPADVLLLPDGSMLVSDDKAGVVYRITYSK